MPSDNANRPNKPGPLEAPTESQSRFEVTLAVSIKEDGVAFFDAPITYSNCNRAVAIVVQQKALALLGELGKLGIDLAVLKGYRAQLEAAGIEIAE